MVKVMVDVREVMVKVMVDVRGPLQELSLGRLTLNRRAHRWQVRPTTGGHASPRPPTSAAAAAAALLLGRAAAAAATVLLRVVQGGGPGPERELTGAAAILLRSSAARSSLITILLLQPVFFLRPWARRKLKTGTGNRDDGQWDTRVRQWRCLVEAKEHGTGLTF